MATAKQVRKAKKAPSANARLREAAIERPQGVGAPSCRGGRNAKPKPCRAKQTFVASHHEARRLRAGLRRYAQYRDLGIVGGDQWLARAHVIKMIPPCDPAEVSKRHYHDVEFQMIYVLKGWMKGEFDGAGVVTMREGSCWLQPPRIKHTVLDYSDDCELLEIIMPADFDTVELG